MTPELFTLYLDATNTVVLSIRCMEKQERTPRATAAAVGEALRQARLAEGLGLRELARESGISAGQLSRIETGKTEQPSLETLLRLAQALNRDADVLAVAAARPEMLRGPWLQEARGHLLARIDALAGPERVSFAAEEAELRRQIGAAQRLERDIAETEADLVEKRAAASVEPTEASEICAAVLDRRLVALHRQRTDFDDQSSGAVRVAAERLFIEVRGQGSLTRTAPRGEQVATDAPALAAPLLQRLPLSEFLPTPVGQMRVNASLPQQTTAWDDRQLRRLQQGWQQLSPPRRRRVLDFVDDQVRLSIQEEINRRKKTSESTRRSTRRPADPERGEKREEQR